MSDTAPVKPNSLGVFDDTDPAAARRRIAIAMFRQGSDPAVAAKAANIPIAEARRYRREWEAELAAARAKERKQK